MADDIDRAQELDQMKAIGSILHLDGGKAANTYRRISVNMARMDEIGDFEKQQAARQRNGG